MKLNCALLVVALAIGSAVGGHRVCKQADDSSNLVSFYNKTIQMNMPCKYNAVLQKCGGHLIRITPGYIAIGKWYRLNTIWMGITVNKTVNDSFVIKKWEGRTTNKVMIKFLNEDITHLFTQKNEDDNDSLPTSELLQFSVSQDGRIRRGVVTMENVFRLYVTPWDPSNRKLFGRSTWAFECLAPEEFVINPYPRQVCGGNTTTGFKYKKLPKGSLTGEQLFLLNVFSDTTDITQVDEKCLQAEDTIQNDCRNKSHREEAIITCGQILMKKKHRACVTKYSCSPMDVFVDCTKWVCSNYTNDTLCDKVAEAIDLCQNFRDGNLTQKVKDKKCHKGGLQIDVSEDKRHNDSDASGSVDDDDSTNDNAANDDQTTEATTISPTTTSPESF